MCILDNFEAIARSAITFSLRLHFLNLVSDDLFKASRLDFFLNIPFSYSCFFFLSSFLSSFLFSLIIYLLFIFFPSFFPFLKAVLLTSRWCLARTSASWGSTRPSLLMWPFPGSVRGAEKGKKLFSVCGWMCFFFVHREAFYACFRIHFFFLLSFIFVWHVDRTFLWFADERRATGLQHSNCFQGTPVKDVCAF